MPVPAKRARPFFCVIGALLSIGAVSSTLAEEQLSLEWKTLPEYMALDRDAQRDLILTTRRVVARQYAETDFPRAECMSWLLNGDTEEGRAQFYDTKGLLKAAADKGSDWKAQQVVAYKIERLCPQTDTTAAQQAD